METVPDVDGDLERMLMSYLNDVRKHRQSQIQNDAERFMNGETNLRNMTLLHVLGNEQFLSPNPHLQSKLHWIEAKYWHAFTINALWGLTGRTLLRQTHPMAAKMTIVAIRTTAFASRKYQTEAIGCIV